MALTADVGEPLLHTGTPGVTDVTFRQLRQLTQGVGYGVVGASDYAVTAPGGMAVSVAAGYAWVPGTTLTGPEGQHRYGVPNTAAKTLNGIAAPVGGTRRDSIVLRVFDEGDAPGGGGLNVGRLEYRVNPVVSTTAEALPANSILIAYVDVTVGAAAITTGMITDMRAVSGPRAVQRGGAGAAIVTVADAKQRLVQAPEGTKAADLLLLPSSPWYGKPYISSGGALAAGAGLNATVPRMQGMLNGRPFDTLANATIPLTASATNRIWYQAQENAAGEVTGFAFVVRTDTTVPTGGQAVLVGEAVTSAGAVTSVASTFRGVIMPGGLIQQIEYLTTISTGVITPGQVGNNRSMDLVGDGHTPMRLTREEPAAYAGSAIDWSLRISEHPDWSGGYMTSQRVYKQPNQPNAERVQRVGYPAFVGKRTFVGYAFHVAGVNAGIVFENSATQRGVYRAEWDF